MNGVKILVHGTHPEILETVLRLINKNEGWTGEGHTEEEKIIELFMQKRYDLVLLGGGLSETSEKKIKALFAHHSPDTPIIQHYGGGSGLLKSEIEGALTKLRQEQVQVQDNPFG
ncbi:MAG: hypothetical protein AAFZ63_29535 [Bacteroidota bacterium]